MVAYLVRVFGFDHLDLAEDVVQDALCRAMETWPLRGVPDNPSAWLMRAARNRAIDLLRRADQFRFFLPELIHLLRQREEMTAAAPPAYAGEIRDDQLRMMFACCHPDLSTAAQVTLILKTLCGFSVAEIASALLSSADSVEKRLGRARQLLRRTAAPPDVGGVEEIGGEVAVGSRLQAVLQAIYLLFNEGYHGSGPYPAVREDLCLEALRLALLVAEHPAGDTPETHALLALLCFSAARLPGRLDEEGDLVQLRTQDRSRWDRELIGRGFSFLARASQGASCTAYHLEAGIAALHCAAPTYEATDWPEILRLYDQLHRLAPSPIVALSRAVALGNAHGPDAGLAELAKLRSSPRLRRYPFHAAALGELHLRAGRPAAAAAHFQEALRLARSPAETSFFTRRLQACGTAE